MRMQPFQQSLIYCAVMSSLLVTTNSYASFDVSNPNYRGVADTLNYIATDVPGIAPTLAPLITALAVTPLEDALSTLVPAADTSLAIGSQMPIAKGLSAVSTRLSNNRLGLHYPDPYISYVAGDKAYDMASWAQIFGGDINQSDRQNIEGFDAHFGGIALGHEWNIMNDFLTLGLGASFNSTKVDSRGIGRNRLEINSSQGFIYGSYNFDSPFYLDAMASLAYHDYDSTRNIVVPLAGPASLLTRAEGDFHGWQFTVRPEIGYQWQQNNFFAIPHAFLQYSHLNVSDYTETGAGGMNLFVQYDNLEELKLAGGLKVGLFHEVGDCLFVPQIHGAITHDFITDPQSSTASFIGGGTNFVTPGFEPDDTSFLIGANLEWWFKNKQNYLNLQYDFEFKEDFNMHSGFLKFKFGWA